MAVRKVLWFRLATGAVIFVASLPVLSVIAASAAAEIFGCRLHEGSVNACPAFGVDIGPTLYHMFVAGWYMVLTLPILAGAAALWAAGELGLLLRRRGQKRR
jgi:hypothetical protein